MTLCHNNANNIRFVFEHQEEQFTTVVVAHVREGFLQLC